MNTNYPSLKDCARSVYNNRISFRFKNNIDSLKYYAKNYTKSNDASKISYYKDKNNTEHLIMFEANNVDGGYYWTGIFHLHKYTVKCVVDMININSMLSFRCINMIKATIRRCC